MLDRSDVYATIPVQNLGRAKSFYADKLGLKPDEERPEGLRYRCGNGGSCCSSRRASRPVIALVRQGGGRCAFRATAYRIIF